MKSKPKHISTLLIAIFMLTGFVSVGSQQQTQSTVNQRDTSKQKAVVDYDADVIKQLKGDSILRLIGNVVFHHNGAIIQCDSAFRYNNERMEFFGNVLVNQDSTNIYGDKAVYDDEANLATVYAPLIKLTNGDSTVMYTYNITFNTKTSVGEFSGGAIVMQRDNMLESQRGFYYSATNDIKLIDDVLMRNPDYQIQTDSLKFNLDTEVTTFLTRTYIWDKEQDFLTSMSGTYERATQTYTFTDDAYLLTPDQESWADSIIYLSLTREALMRSNIQILDTAQQTLAFGDWGYYNDSLKKAILSKMPSVRSWEVNSENREKGDTAYMRADSIYFETFPRGTTKPIEEEETPDSVKGVPVKDSLLKSIKKADSTNVQIDTTLNDTTLNDTTVQIVETVTVDTLPKEIVVENHTVIDTISHQPTVDSLKPLVDSLTQMADTTVTLKSLRKKESNDTTERLIRAFRDVRMYRKDFQGKCDSLVSYSVDSTMSMFGRPVLWNESNQITSDQIDVFTKNEEVDWADFIGSPFIVQKIDTARYNQASGKTLNAFFTKNEISQAVMKGNVRNYYYYRDEEKNNEVMAFSTIESAELDMFFEKRAPTKMKWLGQGEWAIYPLNQIPETQSQRLDGFAWITDGRATSSQEICNRIVRESMRNVYEAMEKPKYGIEKKILQFKQTLLDKGEWIDRNDKARVTPDYFLSPDRF